MCTVARVFRLARVVRIGVRLDVQLRVSDGLGGQFSDSIEWITDQAAGFELQGFEYAGTVHRHAVLAFFERKVSAAETCLAGTVVYTYEHAVVEVRDAP